MIEINFEDASTKKFVISEETTVEELINKIAQKLQLSVSVEDFGLYDSFIENQIKHGLLINNFYYT